MASASDHSTFQKTRISQYFGLSGSQATFGFVDVDVFGDTPLFVDPTALHTLNSAFGHDCVALVRDCFGEAVTAIRGGERPRAMRILSHLREPNEIRLGFSAGLASGHAVGHGYAVRLYDALSKSKAVKTGLLVDLEETILLVTHIGPDLVSDITANIIREPLIRYTQAMAVQYGIPMVSQSSGELWDPNTKDWLAPRFELLPKAGGRKLLLVPKSIVRARLELDPGEFYRDEVLEFYRRHELAKPGSDLVHMLKNGETRVTLRSLKERYGEGKEAAARAAMQYPRLLDRYKQARLKASRPMGHASLAEAVGAPYGQVVVDYEGLLERVLAVVPGAKSATAYQHAVFALLNALFYPSLQNGVTEFPINEGRKRLDIRYENEAHAGFFRGMQMNRSVPCRTIPVEVKNYSNDPDDPQVDRDPKNPELDQLLGRFSDLRGRLGILACRNVKDRKTMTARCRDEALRRGDYVIVLDHDDLRSMVAERVANSMTENFAILRERFDALT